MQSVGRNKALKEGKKEEKKGGWGERARESEETGRVRREREGG